MEIIIILGLIIQYWQVSLVVFIAFFVFLVWYGIKHSNDAENRARLINYMKASDKLVISADKTRSIEKVKEKIADLDREYDKTRDFMGYSGNQLHSDYKEGLVERLHELEEEKWERKADRILQEFYDSYDTIVSGEFDSFRDVEELFREKNRCISLWQKYFAIDLSEYDMTIYPKRYMREQFGEDYDPCMESHEALEKKLSEHVNAMRPEYKRKMALYRIIVGRVCSCGTVQRSELLKQDFTGYIPEEVKCCYKELVKKNRLVEVKLGNRYFVSLSDKELAKRQKKTKKTEVESE